jgi:UDP-2,3-diacylglucosamine pyrophosphatase LpxH
MEFCDGNGQTQRSRCIMPRSVAAFTPSPSTSGAVPAAPPGAQAPSRFAPGPVEALSRRSRSWRSVFLSDLHLGTSRGRPDHVIDFLNHASFEKLFLVGDIFDGWNPNARRGKPGADHKVLLTRLDSLAADGVQVVLVPGNHDATFRRLSGRSLGPMQVCEETHHRLADGRNLLITHGDSADPLMALGATVGWAGGKLDIGIRRANRRLNAWREAMGLVPSPWVEAKLMAMNSAMHPRATYANRLTTRARSLGFEGVVCGHYHIPALTEIDGITYANCGDWLDHFSAVTETAQGALELVRWPEPAPELAAEGRRLPARGLPAA